MQASLALQEEKPPLAKEKSSRFANFFQSETSAPGMAAGPAGIAGSAAFGTSAAGPPPFQSPFPAQLGGQALLQQLQAAQQQQVFGRRLLYCRHLPFRVLLQPRMVCARVVTLPQVLLRYPMTSRPECCVAIRGPRGRVVSRTCLQSWHRPLPRTRICRGPCPAATPAHWMTLRLR